MYSLIYHEFIDIDLCAGVCAQCFSPSGLCCFLFLRRSSNGTGISIDQSCMPGCVIDKLKLTHEKFGEFYT